MTPISVSCDIAAPVEHVFARAVDFAHAAERIEAILGYVDEPELIHRDNLVLTG